MSIPSEVNEFREYFYSLVEQIPEGKVTTYGDLARALGDIRASRAVGKMLNENPRAPKVPCHRVVMSDGKIGGFESGIENKIEILNSEGVVVENNKIVDFEDILFNNFESEKILDKLRENQMETKENVKIEDYFEDIDIVGGVDVSYTKDRGYAALSVWEGNKELDRFIIDKEISFPYIPTYLSFREMPILLDLLDEAEIEPDIILVDGNGILHPRGIGLASHFGVERDIPTIGVAKSQLIGDKEKEVTHENPLSKIKNDSELLGYAFLSSERAKNPIYISPGHRVSHETSFNIVKMYCQYKIPDPIRKAHITATQRRKRE